MVAPVLCGKCGGLLGCVLVGGGLRQMRKFNLVFRDAVEARVAFGAIKHFCLFSVCNFNCMVVEVGGVVVGDFLLELERVAPGVVVEVVV